MLVCEKYKFVLSTESSALESIEIDGQPKVTVGLQFGFYFDRLSFLVLTHLRIWTWVCQFFCGHEPNKHIVWKHLALDFSIFHAPGTNIFTQFRIESWLSRVEFSSHFFLAEGVDYSILDAKKPEDLTEEEKIALLGRPCLGNNPKLQIRIRESREFKVWPI